MVSVDADGVPLSRLVETLGSAVVRVISTPGLETALAREVIVHDPVNPPVIRQGDLVLAVGVRAPSQQAVALVEAAGIAQAAAVVVKAPDEGLAKLRSAADGAGVTLMVLPTAMRWEQISVLMRHAITAAHSSSGSLQAVGDLFGFANVLAKAVGGAVTVEDATSHVLAYSTLHDDVLDAPRREAILGRRVPEIYLHYLRERGVFNALRRSDTVVELEADAELGLSRRLAISVRADTEMLGTLWALEGKVPLGREAEKVMLDASRAASGHLLRAQSVGFTLQQHREDMLRQLLEDRVDVGTAAAALGFDADLPAAVMGIALDSRGTLPADHHAYRRLDELINARAMAFRWHVSSALAGVRMLALLPEVTGDPAQVETGIRRLAVGLAGDAEQAGFRVRVACGPVVPTLHDAAASTASVDEILQCLAREPARGPVASHADVRASVSLYGALAALTPMSALWEGPVARIVEYDAEHGTDYGVTLRAWLDGFGDTGAVARALNVHRNTLRYRLQRIEALSGMRLDDPEERLIAALHLRRL
ncbi:PucR family transcriptional regulator [Nocardioides sp. LHG3406-4]|uniref:PucR family transcriptional regulator n=1 Tax=Nocardioides sp. LHG3406-4 TaxID=2804575 RepID=UPI003CF27215